MSGSTIVAAAVLLLASTAHAQSGGRSPETVIGVGDNLGYTAVNNENSTVVKALYEEALQHLAKHDFAGALALYQKAEKVEPNSPASRIGRAACAFGVGDLAGARKLYEEALKLDPKSSSAFVGLGSVAMTQARYREAAELYEKALAIVERNADAHWGAALAWDRAGVAQKARPHAKRFVELAPTSEWAPAARAMANGKARLPQ